MLLWENPNALDTPEEKKEKKPAGIPGEKFIGHSYTDMFARHSYITTHIFYEDLADL